MKAVEFEADITSEYIRIPDFETFKNQHVRVILLSDERPVSGDVTTSVAKKYDFSDLVGRLNWQGDALNEQQKLRDEWK